MISVRMHSMDSACFVLSANVVQIAIREAENLKPFKDILKETTFSCQNSVLNLSLIFCSISPPDYKIYHLAPWVDDSLHTKNFPFPFV